MPGPDVGNEKRPDDPDGGGVVGGVVGGGVEPPDPLVLLKYQSLCITRFDGETPGPWSVVISFFSPAPPASASKKTCVPLASEEKLR